MGAAGAEHERVDAHADVLSLRLDALPHEHAGALVALRRTRLRADLVVLRGVYGGRDGAQDQ